MSDVVLKSKGVGFGAVVPRVAAQLALLDLPHFHKIQNLHFYPYHQN